MSELLCERDGPLAVVRLHRPRVRNALSGALMETLRGAALALAADPGVRAIVLTGDGPGFCAGSDLKELAGLDREAVVRHEEAAGAVARTLQRLEVPVVAAVEGFAIGGGFLLATSCDLVVSAADARWHLPEVKLGWVPPWGLSGLVDRVGPARARTLVWGAAPITGAEACRLGVVDELAGPGAALSRAKYHAARLALLPGHAVAAAKTALAADARALDEVCSAAFADGLTRQPALASLAGYAARRA
ncbi:enoyl-CoA hydratase/isomerase family protein [Actinocorallia sp. A-T 12471]|uniref:enoyl-CoA hydratase/isomerase family protein n=1 Tax=Actinocorallia sp. A-T 12471 TaxID=3089813 RepID=UPI0029CC15DF|nr:enoyl-CoA hydratase/isomerase family protein [Actinocorallia sp. A-T 12471]MDX6741589.1 enoyl-CoA hydratase/isomerase family protein [Actinocorallia sp. A-T 12471]